MKDAAFLQLMKRINKRARLALYLLLSLELMLVSVYYSWGRPHITAVHAAHAVPAPHSESQPAAGI